ncbi:MAG: class I SAM-dependent methyltransferase [Acidothermaceae bacterium]
MPIGLRAWDASRVGPTDAPTVVLRSPRALRRLLGSPGELGLARAYVTGDLDIEGDPAEALRLLWLVAARQQSKKVVTPAALVRLAVVAARVGAIGRVPKPPDIEARVGGRLHSRRRDREVIAHHYDTSNAFYSLLLDPRMAYSCAYWTPETENADLATAQVAKFDLVCRKLGLAPGARLLDIGCGWGGLAIHAARHYGVRVVGVTLSKEQLSLARSRAHVARLSDVIDLRLADYRDLADDPFDAVCAIEMGEHVGAGNYPNFAALLRELVRPGGRVLVQQMSRQGRHRGGGAFIERYVAPDMDMRPVGQTVDLLERAGLEVRDVQALRENYTRTINAWRDQLEHRWNDAVGLLGAQRARMWRMYLIGSALAFEQGRMGVDQILAVRPGVFTDLPPADAPPHPQR